MATSTAPKHKTEEPALKDEKPASPHADRPTSADDDRRLWEERVQGKTAEYDPKPKKTDDK